MKLAGRPPIAELLDAVTDEPMLVRTGVSRYYIYKIYKYYPDYDWTSERDTQGDGWSIYVQTFGTAPAAIPKGRGPVADRRLPVEPLLRQAALGLGTDGPLTAIADWVGCTRNQIHTWRRYGIPMQSADRLATSLGLHVTLIWPDAYNDITEDAA